MGAQSNFSFVFYDLSSLWVFNGAFLTLDRPSVDGNGFGQIKNIMKGWRCGWAARYWGIGDGAEGMRN